MSVPMKPLCANVDKPKYWSLASRSFTSDQKAGIAPNRRGNTMGDIGHWKDEKRREILALNKTRFVCKKALVMQISSSPFRRRL